ncbi:MAG: chromate efflux transporter [Rhodospirillaceae bacterium]|nr:chromate efflux transporter [Rhodospirillaceae bacterium]
MPTFREAVRTWFKIGCLGFGGPAGQIALMHRIVVDEKRWLDERRFLHALNFCMLLPGPEAQQLATYIGWRLHGTRGGLAAGLLFVLPGAVIVLALSLVYAFYRDVALVAAIFYGIKPAVAAIVVEALVRIGRRALKGPLHVAIAAFAFVGIFLFDLPFPLIIAAAGLAGLLLPIPHAERTDEVSVAGAVPSLGRTLATILIWAAIWLGPVIALFLAFGQGHVLSDIAIFFSKMAVVTFGGAYAVLAYVAQAAVGDFGWLAPGEMVDGLGLAETTPGPLILVLQFVGFMAAFRDGLGIDPALAGAIGAALVLWVTFAPCFLWIFAAAPYVERLYANRTLGRILAAITAAVVGVILNLALWFLLHVLFADVRQTRLGPLHLSIPEWSTIDPFALLLAVAAAIALLRFKLGLLPVLGGAILLGVLWRLGAAAWS